MRVCSSFIHWARGCSPARPGVGRDQLIADPPGSNRSSADAVHLRAGHRRRCGLRRCSQCPAPVADEERDGFGSARPDADRSGTRVPHASTRAALGAASGFDGDNTVFYLTIAERDARFAAPGHGAGLVALRDDVSLGENQTNDPRVEVSSRHRLRIAVRDRASGAPVERFELAVGTEWIQGCWPVWTASIPRWVDAPQGTILVEGIEIIEGRVRAEIRTEDHREAQSEWVLAKGGALAADVELARVDDSVGSRCRLRSAPPDFPSPMPRFH